MKNNKTYIIFCYNEKNEKIFEFDKDSFPEIEAKLESQTEEIKKAVVYLNSDPYTEMGHYSLHNNKMIYNSIHED